MNLIELDGLIKGTDQVMRIQSILKFIPYQSSDQVSLPPILN